MIQQQKILRGQQTMITVFLAKEIRQLKKIIILAISEYTSVVQGV